MSVGASIHHHVSKSVSTALHLHHHQGICHHHFLLPVIPPLSRPCVCWGGRECASFNMSVYAFHPTHRTERRTQTGYNGSVECAPLIFTIIISYGRMEDWAISLLRREHSFSLFLVDSVEFRLVGRTFSSFVKLVMSLSL